MRLAIARHVIAILLAAAIADGAGVSCVHAQVDIRAGQVIVSGRVIDAEQTTLDSQGSRSTTILPLGPGELPPGEARVVLRLDRPAFFLGENVLVHFCVESTSKQPITISYGGDYRGGSRSQRFKFRVVERHGVEAPDPDPHGYNEGGIGGPSTIAPGRNWCQSLPLVRYARIDSPGTYDIRVTHDLGWPAGAAPEGRAVVTLKMPAASDAEAVVAAMERLPPNQGMVMGRLSGPIADFSALRYGVYLDPLLRRARRGQVEAITGIGVIPTPAATRALIDLAGSFGTATGRRAAQTLAMRLPDPELIGALARRSSFTDDLSSPRTYLRNASWRPEFADDVRAAAKGLLAMDEVQDIVEGAFFVEAVGEPGDATDLSVALTRAIERTLTLPFETGGYPRPRGAAAELMRAAHMLIARGYVPPAAPDSPGDIALWLVAVGRGARPDGWLEGMAKALEYRIPYVREVALDQMPAAVPESLVPTIGDNLAAVDIGARIAACKLAGRAKLVGLHPQVSSVAARATEDWLIEESMFALYVLGGRFEVLTLRAARLVEPDVAVRMLRELLSVFESSGMSFKETIPPDEAHALSERWLAFLTSHRVEFESDVRMSLDRTDIPTNLVPAGWELRRSGKPIWPPR